MRAWKDYIGVVGLFLTAALLVFLLFNGSRPARSADQRSAENFRMLRSLMRDCHARGGCRDYSFERAEYRNGEQR